MCAVSMTIDYGRRLWPEPFAPAPLPPPIDWEAWRRLYKAALKFDRDTKQPDCEDPAKVAWMEAMEKRMKELEEKLAQR